MKFLTQRCLIASTLLLSTISLQAEIVKFSASAEYCFPQTSVRSELGKLDRVTLDHNSIVDKKDYFKVGDIFVGFRRKSHSEVVWFADGSI